LANIGLAQERIPVMEVMNPMERMDDDRRFRPSGSQSAKEPGHPTVGMENGNLLVAEKLSDRRNDTGINFFADGKPEMAKTKSRGFFLKRAIAG